MLKKIEPRLGGFLRLRCIAIQGYQKDFHLLSDHVTNVP